MNTLIALYQQRLNLQQTLFSHVDHEDTMVATVFRVTQTDGTQLILKICSRPDDYLREVYFLRYFWGKVPVPRLMQLVPPETGIHGAILMQCLPGKLLNIMELNETLAYEIGTLLAKIHIDPVKGYGDLIKPDTLSADPRVHFTMKFKEGLDECSNHLPEDLIERCQRYFDEHLDLLASADGPRIIHRDFRPGNLIVYEGKLQGIIDWSSARGGFAEEDFCPMEHGEWSTHPVKSSFLAGYTSIRPVPDYKEMMPLLRLSKVIATIGFTVKRGTWNTRNARIYQYNRQFLETFFNKISEYWAHLNILRVRGQT